MATHDTIFFSEGRKINRLTLQRAIHKPPRGFGWKLWVLAPACLIVLACAGTSPQPPQSQPNRQSNELPLPAVGAQDTRLSFIPAIGSRVELQGTATIGPWKSRSTDIQAKIVLDTDAAALNALFDRVQSAVQSNDNRIQPNPPTLSVRSPAIGDISVPVTSLRGNSGGMDRDLRNALMVRQHPTIEYLFQQLQQSALQWDSQDRQAELKLRIVGQLNMAGVGRSITMDVIVKRDSHLHFLAHAQAPLLMSDFGVTPPGAFFGLIKANDQVVVVFDLDLVLMDHSSNH